ncbi:hypothetical protein D3C76_727700 [compost metagenome]
MTPAMNALALQIPGQAQQEIMAQRTAYLRQAFTAQGFEQTIQTALQRLCIKTRRQQAPHRLGLTGVL